ncbi:MAG: hypothetical protein B6V02_01655 [Thermoprotei archaeon ex4572_64]|nr:MAG: hypothetical protein B6V02_01655 [Thermoprotei archaeon ex4572_64]
MVKDRLTIRLVPVSNLRQLIARVLYSKKNLIDYALIILKKAKDGIHVNDIESLSRELGLSFKNVKYIIDKLQSIGMLEVKDDTIVLSRKFINTLDSMIKIWEEFTST